MFEAAPQLATDLIMPGRSLAARAAVVATLVRFGAQALAFAKTSGISIVTLTPRQPFLHVSPALRRLGVDVDAWPAPPSGLFVVEEKTVYLRSRSPMTVAHEFGHALDCALGGGVYRSGIDPRVRAAFAAAKEFVTPYAGTGIDEYFAENLRAFVECNDPASLWPRATRARLKSVDPAMYDYVEALFSSEFARAA